MRQGRIAGRVMAIALCATVVVFATPAFAGTAVFTGDSDPVLLTAGNGTLTYAADTFTVTTAGGWSYVDVDVTFVATPALVGLGEVEFTMSDVSGVGAWWDKFSLRIFIRDPSSDVGILDCAFLPIGGGANVAAVITMWDGGWGNETQIAADWALMPVGVAMHTKVEITGTAINMYYHDGLDWVASAATADLTNLPILGDVTAAGYTTWPQISFYGEAAEIPFVFDELRLTGPGFSNVNIESGQIVIDPQTPITEGMEVTLTAPAGGSDYVWDKDGLGTLDNDPPRVTGVYLQTLTFDPVEVGDSGVYTCTYDDGSKGIVTTVPFALWVAEGVPTPVAGLLGLLALAGAVALGGLCASRRTK